MSGGRVDRIRRRLPDSGRRLAPAAHQVVPARRRTVIMKVRFMLVCMP